MGDKGRASGRIHTEELKEVSNGSHFEVSNGSQLGVGAALFPQWLLQQLSGLGATQTSLYSLKKPGEVNY